MFATLCDGLTGPRAGKHGVPCFDLRVAGVVHFFFLFIYLILHILKARISVYKSCFVNLLSIYDCICILLIIKMFYWLPFLCSLSVAPRVVVVVSSLYRDPNLVKTTLRTAESIKEFSEIHVYGYNPNINSKKIVGHPFPSSPVHNAYRWLSDRPHLLPTHALANGDPFFVNDSVKRATWRTSLGLDAWMVLNDAMDNTDADIIVWLENDAIVKPHSIESALHLFFSSSNDGASCYGKHGAIYKGSGAVCIMFKTSNLREILKHIIGYHMVQPFDWILRDWSKGKWTTYDAALHGLKNKKHESTLFS